MVDPFDPFEQRVDRERFTTLERLVKDEGHRLVVSFGGGAVPGLAGNIGLAYLLEQLDLKKHVEEVWGTSAGAIVDVRFEVEVLEDTLEEGERAEDLNIDVEQRCGGPEEPRQEARKRDDGREACISHLAQDSAKARHLASIRCSDHRSAHRFAHCPAHFPASRRCP